MDDQRISRTAAIDWLEESARYFLKRPTNGEDSAFWANRMNAENALKIAATLRGDQAWKPPLTAQPSSKIDRRTKMATEPSAPEGADAGLATREMTWDEAEKLALKAIHDADGRGLVGQGRNHLHQRVARAILHAHRAALKQD